MRYRGIPEVRFGHRLDVTPIGLAHGTQAGGCEGTGSSHRDDVGVSKWLEGRRLLPWQ